MNLKKLVAVAQKLSLRYSQRLGYLLDFLEYDTRLLHKFVSSKKLRYVPLRSDGPIENAQKNEKWHIIVNEKVESDI